MRSILVLILVALIGCEPVERPRRREPEYRRSEPQTIEEYPRRGQDLSRSVAREVSEHPRLILLADDVSRIKQRIDDDPLAHQWFLTIHQRADKLLGEPPMASQGKASLRDSREALVRITTLAAAYRLTGDNRFALRATREMLAAAKFDDWLPSDFLTTAEMTNAVAIGYDWVYGTMSPEERATIRQAIVEKGLRPGLKAYDSGAGWVTARHNWNLVCNGGLIVGALAVLDEEPRTAHSILSQARESIRYGMSCFAPDGGWEEGPTYWNYATRYTAFALASLQSALNDDWGLTRAPGFARTGLFRIYTTGPTGLPFNFGDSEPVIGSTAQMLWMARALNQPVYAAFESQQSERDPGVFDLLWYRPAERELIRQLPRAATFRGVDVVSMRSDWNDPQATFVAFKGGSNEAHHGHLDLGTFVLDALGQRWALAMGADDYGLPGYFGEKRFSYYRTSTRGQNTLSLDNRNQETQARAPIVAFSSERDRAFAVLDLSDAYRQDARRAQRGVALLNGRQVLIQDEFDLTGDAEVKWSFHTEAKVELSGSTARLSQGGKELSAQILSPAEARFDVVAVHPPPPQKQQDNLSNLIIRMPRSRGPVRIAVLLTPGDAPAPAPRLTPLKQWSAR